MDDDIIIVHEVNDNVNLDDLVTKSLPGCKRVQLRCVIMYSDNPNIP